MAFKTCFFGYSNLPSIINYNDQVLIPLKKIRTILQGTEQSGPYAMKQLRQLCNFLNIPLYCPVAGLYCIKESDEFFFLVKLKELIGYPLGMSWTYDYDNLGNLTWLGKKRVSGKTIKKLYQDYILDPMMGLSKEEFYTLKYLYRKGYDYNTVLQIAV
jgi:hypothetical protein